MGSFFGKIKSFFSKFFNKVPSWSQHLSAVLSFVAPLTEGILQAFDPTVAPEAHQIIAEVQTDLAVAGAVASQSHGATPPETLVNTITSINTNLSELLTAGHIKDPATLAKVTGISNIITGELTAVLGVLQPATAPAK